MANGECVIGARHGAEIAALQDRAGKIEDINEQQWTAINQIRNRLPPWGTAIISLLTFLCGVLLTVAVK